MFWNDFMLRCVPELLFPVKYQCLTKLPTSLSHTYYSQTLDYKRNLKQKKRTPRHSSRRVEVSISESRPEGHTTRKTVVTLLPLLINNWSSSNLLPPPSFYPWTLTDVVYEGLTSTVTIPYVSSWYRFVDLDFLRHVPLYLSSFTRVLTSLYKGRPTSRLPCSSSSSTSPSE